jgi:hypothetical protein
MKTTVNRGVAARVLNADEDSTGGDDADDLNLPDLHNDKADRASKKRNAQERFSAEQKRAEDRNHSQGIPGRPASARVGVWIDSRTALIVPAEKDAAAGTAVMRKITTNLEKQLHLSSGERAKTSLGRQITPPDDMREDASKENLKSFLDEVVAAVRGASSIFIFGHGEAMDEFKKRLTLAGLGSRIDSVEAVSTLSEPQIAAKVRTHFRFSRGPRQTGPSRRSRTAVL